ncbi:uncharacterized protein LOC142519622 [Primulina tabacum]|uniref:uncharacterized protein LOC142519622 n=1 Tax=Primulina tabacum TaxID=48773 RepID=UPI003F59A14F
MGCTSSKRVEDTVVVPYRPSPASFSFFDVYAIEEPWLNRPETENEKKPSHVPAPILEKLNATEESPRTWDEISKVLEDMKPKLSTTLLSPPPVPQKTQETRPSAPRARPLRRKSFSFHTLEELEARANSSKPTPQTPKFEFEKSKTSKTYSQNGVIAEGVPRSLNENMFIVRDKFEKEQERKSSGSVKR